MDDKSLPPSYPQNPQMGFVSSSQPPMVGSYPSQQGYEVPPQPQSQQQSRPGMPYAQGPQGSHAPPMSSGAQYQQQLFAMCAQGNHDATTKYGIAGIIIAVVCFPCGLFALLADREKRCVRCGSRVA